LHRACEKGFKIKVKIFLDYGDDLNLLDNFNNTPLHYACTYNMIDVANILLQNPKIDVDIKCCQSRITPFLCAAYNKNIEMMELLLEYGANINACDINGSSALFNLCKDENKNIFQFLLNHNINVKIQDKSGMTILHSIAIANQKELMQLILDYDPSIVDYQDIYGKTALHYAAMNNYRDIIILLLKNKASVKIKDKKNYTAID
ncbi:ankyrin, partial [Anaeromyces robustus]